MGVCSITDCSVTCPLRYLVLTVGNVAIQLKTATLPTVVVTSSHQKWGISQ